MCFCSCFLRILYFYLPCRWNATSTGLREGPRRTASSKWRCWTRWSWPHTVSGHLHFLKWGPFGVLQQRLRPHNSCQVSDLVTNLSSPPYSERLQREERGEAVPVHGLAGPRGARAPHSVPGLPPTGESLQSSRCRAHGGALQVRNNTISQKHPEAWNWFCSLHLL